MSHTSRVGGVRDVVGDVQNLFGYIRVEDEGVDWVCLHERRRVVVPYAVG